MRDKKNGQHRDRFLQLFLLRISIVLFSFRIASPRFNHSFMGQALFPVLRNRYKVDCDRILLRDIYLGNREITRPNVLLNFRITN